MRKLLMVMAVIMAVVMAAGMASATLLGIKNYAGAVPDIYYDAGGTASYNAENDLLKVNAWDYNLWLKKPGLAILINGNVSFYLEVGVDDNGNFTGTGKMEEIVKNDFSFEWEGTIYSFTSGDTFLSGPVIAFGWDETTHKTFDYLLGKVSGELVDYGLWPTSPPTGGYVDLAEAFPSWNESWSLIPTEKGDKYPTPEPATLLLLGSGLIALAGIGRKTLKR